VMGSPGTGIGMALDGTNTTTCTAHQITASSLTSFATAIQVTPSCANTTIIAPSYSSTSAHLVDAGVNTQTIGAPPDAQNITFPGPANSMAQYFTVASLLSATAGNLECFQTGTAVVADCAGLVTAKNFLGVALTTGASGTIVPIQVSGTAIVSLDVAANPAAGNYVCASTMTGQFSQGHLSTSPCPAGQQIGIAAQTATAVTSVLVFLQRL
jgi:hypothetical protein